MKLDRLYLDYNATSPLSKSVQDWLKSGEVLFANPSSQHSDGKSSRKVINETRSLLYKVFNLEEKKVKLFFHSGATEGIFTLAYSFSEWARLSGKDLLICYSKNDHPAVTSLEERYFGPHVKFLELQRDKNLNYLHEVNFETIKDKKDNNPDLLILYHHLWVHNETGAISPLEDLFHLKKIPDLYLHIDSVQAPGKVVDWTNLTTGDIWTFSAHKFGALKGIGFTFFSDEISFYPLLSGGGQQGNLRSGTENPQSVKSLALALNDVLKIDVKKNASLRKQVAEFLKSELDGIGGLLDGPLMASNTLYFYFNNLSSDVALALFDIHGIEISAGSACSSGAAKPSQVLLQMGLDEVAKNGLRLSMALESTQEEIDHLMDRMRPLFNKLRTR